jgi:PAS domain S-box-containing protein
MKKIDIDRDDLDLLDEIPHPVMLVNPDTSIVYVNPALEKLTGFTSSDLIGKKHPYPYWPEVYRPQYSREMAENIPAFNRLERVFWKKDGQPFWVELTTIPLKEKGELKYILSNWVDVTVRKTAEEKLRRSEERFRLVAENACEWIWEVDAGGLYTYSSPVVERVLGYAPCELVGKMYFYDLFPDNVREIMKQTALEAFKEKLSFQAFVNPNVRKDGRTVIMETTGAPILNENGELLGYRGIDTDVTESKLKLGQLQAERNKLQNFLDSMDYGISIQDPDFNIIFQNKHSYREYGQGTGEKCFTFFQKRAGICPECPVEKCLKDGRTQILQRRIFMPGGEIRYLEIVASPVKNTAGEVLSVVESVQDITRRTPLQ